MVKIRVEISCLTVLKPEVCIRFDIVAVKKIKKNAKRPNVRILNVRNSDESLTKRPRGQYSNNNNNNNENILNLVLYFVFPNN